MDDGYSRFHFVESGIVGGSYESCDEIGESDVSSHILLSCYHMTAG